MHAIFYAWHGRCSAEGIGSAATAIAVLLKSAR